MIAPRQSSRSQPSRRGVALVAALIASGVLATATVVVAGATLGARRAEDARALQAARIAAVDASSSLVAEWLAGDASTVVLPLGATEPRVQVCNISLPGVGSEPVRLRITAFDELGMLAISAVGGGSPLAGLLPVPIRACIEHFPGDEREPTGPDSFSLLEVRARGARVFPSAVAGDGPPTIGGVVSFAAVQSGLNIRTAPWPIVEGVVAAAGSGGLEVIRRAREAGEIPLLPATTRRETPRRLQLTTTSDRWAFRIDVGTRGLSAGVWSVWARGRQGWQEVQRVRITD